MQGKVSSSLLAHEFEDPSAATSDTSHGIVGDQYRQPDLGHDQFIYVAQQCSTSGQHNTTFRDIAAKIRRRLFERLSHRTHDTLQWFLQRLQYLVRVQGE